LILVLLFLLTGCGKRPQPDVEHFQAEVVATLQKPIGEPESNLWEETPAFGSEFTETALPSQPFPTNAPEGTPTLTASIPMGTGYPIGTEPTILMPVPSVTANLTGTPTPTPGVSDWKGVWNIWYQTAGGGYIPANLTIQVDGTGLTGLAKIEGIDYIFDGEIYKEGTQVEGKWKTAANKGAFWWRLSSQNTFVGSREKRFGFCGDRAAVTQPSLCREVPQD